VLSANRWLPHFGQNRRRTWLPLSATLVYSAGFPSISIDEVGKTALTVPLDDRYWQSRHQQILEMTGSPTNRYRMLRQRQPPVSSCMGDFL